MILNHLRSNILLLIVFFGLSSGILDGSQKHNASSTEHQTMKHYPYLPNESKDLVIEVHSPKGHRDQSSPVPGIIMFHGGGWRKGTPTQFRFLCEYFASRGLVTATVTYTLGEGKAKCVQDAIAAIRWFKENAKELGVDPTRIITGGGSAGGHISLLATTNPKLNPPTDHQKADTSVVAYLLFNPALTIQDEADVNFTKHVTANLAPSIVFFGDQDHDWLKGWNHAREKMKSLGIKNMKTLIAEGENHAFFNPPPWRELTIRACDRFLNDLGLIRGEPTLQTPSTKEKLVEADH